jgi:hypothetical protein
MYLLEDAAELAFADPIIILSGVLAAVALGYGVWWRSRLRRRPRRGPAYDVFRNDVAGALIAWGAAQLAVVLGWAARVEGLRMPIWSYAGLAMGLAIAALAWRRERRQWPAHAKAEGDEVLADGRVQRGTSQTWEMGLLAAGGLALGSYLVTVDHAYGHPIHWLTTALAMLGGYALGLAIWSPRFRLVAVRSTRPAARERSTAGRAKRPAHKRSV